MEQTTQTPVKINEWLVGGFEVFKNNLLTLVLATFLAMILAGVSFGLLAGPMLAGLVLMILSMYDQGGRAAAQPMDVFHGFGFFLPAFLFGLFWGLGLGLAFIILNFIPFIGQLLALALLLAVSAALMFGMFLIVDQGLNFWDASMQSWNMVRSNLMPFMGFGIIVSVIGQCGALACAIGVIFTMPLGLCITAVAYREVFSGVVTEKAAPAYVEKSESEILVGGRSQPGQAARTWEVDEKDGADPDSDLPGVERLGPGNRKR